jgi:hypothetical protein
MRVGRMHTESVKSGTNRVADEIIAARNVRISSMNPKQEECADKGMPGDIQKQNIPPVPLVAI